MESLPGNKTNSAMMRTTMLDALGMEETAVEPTSSSIAKSASASTARSQRNRIRAQTTSKGYAGTWNLKEMAFATTRTTMRAATGTMVIAVVFLAKKNNSHIVRHASAWIVLSKEEKTNVVAR